ncbi:hypothetical protein ACE6H2_010380 [Prunus campanulata]
MDAIPRSVGLGFPFGQFELEANVAVTSEYGCRKIKCHWDKQRSSRIFSVSRDYDDDPTETPSTPGAPYGQRS